MSMTELAAQLLESPRRGLAKAPQIIQQVQAVLNDEKTRRQAFYEWMDGDMKSDRRSDRIHQRRNRCAFTGITQA